MLTRRHLLASGGCAICASRALSAPARIFDGCAISTTGYEQFRQQNDGTTALSSGIFARNRHWHTTGNRAIDRDLDRALSVTADLFGVNPAFGFYDPASLQNPVGLERDPWGAFASSEGTDIPGTWGTVAFSWNLFRDEFYNRDSSGLTIMAIVAHEFGHIVQFRSGRFLQHGYPRKSEVNADFLAGYFLGTRKKSIPSLRFQKAGEMFARFGRGNNENPQRSHGDETERLNAAEAGFRVAYVEGRPLDQALSAGWEYVGV
jgi:hypothetical protein